MEFVYLRNICREDYFPGFFHQLRTAIVIVCGFTSCNHDAPSSFACIWQAFSLLRLLDMTV